MSSDSQRRIVLAEALSDYSAYLTEDKLDKLVRFYDLLIEKNKVMNLTAITDFDEVAVKHFADSLSLVKILDPGMLSGHLSVIDIGTGAGFPGIPLKICFPDIQLTLLDSLNKRLVFLNEVISDLKLTGVQTLHARAEDAAHDPVFREKYRLAVSRAVANLSTLVEYCLPFVSVGGQFISYKGSKASDELSSATNAIRILGGGDVRSVSFRITDCAEERTLISISKKKSTISIYPRLAGKPSKEPLT